LNDIFLIFLMGLYYKGGLCVVCVRVVNMFIN